MKITPKFINFNKAPGTTAGVTKDLTEYVYTYIAPELMARLDGVVDEAFITVTKGTTDIKVQIIAFYMGREVKIDEQGGNFYEVISFATKTFIKLVLKTKDKYFSNKKNSRRASKEVLKEFVVEEEMKSIEEDNEFLVKKIKRFNIKPMSVEEAIMQMNLLEHNFFIFRDADTELISVVYKRKNGTYGLIEEA